MSAAVEFLASLNEEFAPASEVVVDQPVETPKAVYLQESQEALKARATSLADQAKAITITDQVSYETASRMALDLKAVDKQIVEKFAEPKKKAHEAHRAVCSLEAELRAPGLAALQVLSPAIGNWEVEQQRIADARAAEEAARIQREMDEQIEAEIVAAEAQGASPEEVEAIIERPFVAPAPRVAPAYARVQGVSSATRWICKIENLRELCKAVGNGTHPTELIIGIEKKKGETHFSSPALNKLAAALKQSFNVPGCKAVPVNSARFGGR